MSWPAPAVVVAAAFVLGGAARHRIPAAARRGRHLDSCQLPGGHFARQIRGAGRARSAALVEAIAGGARWSARRPGATTPGTDPYGPNRNELFVALDAVRQLAQRQASRPDLVEELAATAAGGDPRRVLQLHAADHRQRHRGRDRLARRSGGHHHAVPTSHALRRLGSQTLDVLQPGARCGRHRPRAGGRSGAAADRPRPPGDGALRAQRPGRAGRHRAGHRRPHRRAPFFEGERRFDITVRYVPEARADAVSDRRHPRPHARRRPRAARRSWRDIEVVNGASIIARRENRAADRGAHQRPRARSGQLRGRGAGAVRAAPSRCRRAITSTGAASSRTWRAPAAGSPLILPLTVAHHLRAAVLRLRLGRRRRAGADERAVRARRRHRRRCACAAST